MGLYFNLFSINKVACFIHKRTLKSFFELSMIKLSMFFVCNTDYFYLCFLKKSDLHVSCFRKNRNIKRDINNLGG